MSATSGGWSGAAPISYGYQWERCDYAASVLANSPGGYWRLGEGAGTTVANQVAGGEDGLLTGSFQLGQPSAIADGDTAVYFNGGDGTIANYGLAGAGVNPSRAVTIEWWYNGMGSAPARDKWLIAKSTPTEAEPSAVRRRRRQRQRGQGRARYRPDAGGEHLEHGCSLAGG